MSELIALSAVIGDRSYRVKISPEDEEVVRRTLKSINEKIVEFKTLFAGKDMQDYISMVLVWYASEQHAAIAVDLEKDTLSDQLNALERLIDNQLNN